MTLKQRRKLESREKILKAASQLFREKGFEATGIDELMEEAGLTAGAFYAHFKSKKELLKESLLYGLEKNRHRLLQGTEDLQGPQKLQMILSRYVSELHRDHPQAGCPLASIASELSRAPKETSAIISNYLNELIQILEPAFSGHLKERRAEVLRMFSQAVGAIVLSRMVEKDLSDEILKASQKVSHG